MKVATMKVGNELQRYIATKLPDNWTQMPTGCQGKPDFAAIDGSVLLQVKNAYNSGNSSHHEVYSVHGLLRWHRMNKNGTQNWSKLCEILGVADGTLNELDFMKYLSENK